MTDLIHLAEKRIHEHRLNISELESFIATARRLEDDEHFIADTETAPSSESHEGLETPKRIPGSDSGSEDSVSPLRRSSGVSATPLDSPQAKPGQSHRAGLNNPLTKKEEVRLCHEQHPSWTAVEIAAELGFSKGSVSGHLSRLGIQLSKTREAKHKVQSVGKHSGGSLPIKAAKPNTAPSIPSQRLVEAKPISKPRTNRFYLREQLGRGKFLHMTGQGLTDSREYAWVGSQDQLLAARKKFSITKDLVEEAEEK